MSNVESLTGRRRPVCGTSRQPAGLLGHNSAMAEWGGAGWAWAMGQVSALLERSDQPEGRRATCVCVAVQHGCRVMCARRLGGLGARAYQATDAIGDNEVCTSRPRIPDAHAHVAKKRCDQNMHMSCGRQVMCTSLLPNRRSRCSLAPLCVVAPRRRAAAMAAGH